MEPLPVFDGAGAIAATWVQTEDSVTLWVPLPAHVASSGCRPEVEIRPQRLTVRLSAAPRSAPEAGGTDGAETGQPPEGDGSDPPTILLDNDLSGVVAVSESAWTVSDLMLTIELAKRPEYGASESAPPAPLAPSSRGRSALAAPAEAGVPRAAWWPCCIRGGRKGPEDPKARLDWQPEMTRLDSKIGEQAESKKSFQGKSKFQW